jgi:hypothetical protein
MENQTKNTIQKMNKKIVQLFNNVRISRRSRLLLRRRELALASSKLKRLETRFSYFIAGPKPLLLVGVLIIALQPMFVTNINSAGAASNPTLALTGYIWENEDGTSPDTVTQIAAADGTIEAPWGSRINLRAQLKNTGDALSNTNVGLFYDKGDGYWNQVSNNGPKTNPGYLPINTVLDNTGSMGRGLSIATDKDNIIWVSYHDNISRNLRVAQFVGSGGSGCTSSAWTCTTVDSVDDVGFVTSIAFDSNNTPWVAYYDDTNDNLEVAKYVGSGGTGCATAAWECSTVDSTDSVGNYPFIAFDSTGVAWISYQDFTANTINVAKYTGSGGTGCAIASWTCTGLDSIGTSATVAYNSIAFDEEGKAWVSYKDETNADLMIAEYVGSGGTGCDVTTWTCTIVDNGALTGGDNYLAIDKNGTPWVSYTIGTDLGVAKYVGSGGDCTSVAWDCTTVETTNTVGVYTSIAFDENNNPWVVHRDSTSNNMRIAKYVGSGGTGCAVTDWSCTAADVSAYTTGLYTRIAFNNYGDAIIAYQDSSNTSLEIMQMTDWQSGGGCSNNNFASNWECTDIVTTGGAGRSSSMALDNSGIPWIAYYYSSTTDLYIARYVGSGGTGCDVSSWDCSVIETTSSVGEDVSLEFDVENRPWISYRDITNFDLRVARYVGTGGTGCATTAWTCQGVDTAANVNDLTSISIDSTGNAWVSYRDNTAGTLKVARYVGAGGTGCAVTSWTCTTVESGNSNGAGSSIAFDPDGNAWVSFFSTGGVPSDQLQIARYVGTGGTGCDSAAWTCTVVHNGDVVNNTSLAFDPSGNAWVAFKITTGDLLTAKYVGSSGTGCVSTAWTCTIVEDTNDNGQGASLAFDPSGNPWISYQDETNLTIKIARYVESGGSGCASSAWTCNVVQSSIPNSNTSSTLVFDTNGTAWLSYYDDTAVDLKLAKLERAGEILISPSQRYVNGAVISESHADMTSVTDTANRDDADCIGGGTWNNGRYFSSTMGSSVSLPVGSVTAQCTEIVFTIDLSQAEIGSKYRFKIATSDNWNQNRGIWRGLSGGGQIPELLVTDISTIIGKDNNRRLPNCDTDSSWGCEVIDTSTSSFQYPKIAFDANGNPWVTWEDNTNDAVVVANYVGTGGTGCSTAAWNCVNVAPAGLYGGFSAIASSEDGNIWISYYANAQTALGAAKYVGSGGNCDTLYGANGSDAWNCYLPDNGANNIGERTDIAIDANGNPWISYYDTTAFDLKVAYFVGSGGNCTDTAWNCETVDATGTSGRYNAIAIGADGAVWVANHDHSTNSGNDNLRIAKYVGSGGNCTSRAWDCKIVDDVAGEYMGLAIDHNGDPWISYRSNVTTPTNDIDLRVARYVGSGGTGCFTGVTDWSCVQVDGTIGSLAAFSGLAIDSQGNPWVSYTDSTNANLRVARYVGSGGTGCSTATWQCNTIDSANTVGRHPDIAFDNSGNAWVVHTDDTNFTVRLSKTHRPIAPPSISNNNRLKLNNAGSNFARYTSTFGRTNTNAPGSCNGTADYFGACAIFHASGDYDTITAQANESPYWTVAQRFDSNSELPTAQWEGQSTLAPNTAGTAGDLVLQVYRYGTTNAWETIASDNASGTCSTVNCRLEGIPSGTASEYFKSENGKYWVYYRFYQEPSTSSSITFKTDQFKATTNAQRARHGGFMLDGYKRPINWR